MYWMLYKFNTSLAKLFKYGKFAPQAQVEAIENTQNDAE
jgi:hypothetical protein